MAWGYTTPMRRTNIVLKLVAIVLLLLAAWGIYQISPKIAWVGIGMSESQSPPQNSITDFESCVAAGNPVMESYPRQCRANGQTFVEDINAFPHADPHSPEPELVF